MFCTPKYDHDTQTIIKENCIKNKEEWRPFVKCPCCEYLIMKKEKMTDLLIDALEKTQVHWKDTINYFYKTKKR